jgi:para-nitrobenzyl esterase
VGGGSAGAMAASALILNPKVKGLFQKAILQSGTIISYPFVGLNAEQNHDIAKKRSQKLFSEFGVEDSDSGIDMLRSLDPFLLAYHCAYDYDFPHNRGSFMVPFLDGNVLPVSPYRELKNHNYNDVSVLMGYNTNEGTLFVNRDITENELNAGFFANFDKNTAESLKNLYKLTEKSSVYEKTSEFMGDVMFNLGMKIFADNLSSTQKVYVYHFDYLPKSSKGDITGVHHSSELKYAFNNLSKDASDKSRDVAEVFHLRLVNFLKTGDPNSDGAMNTLIKWKSCDSTDNAVLRIGAYTGVEEFKLKEKLTKLEEIFFGSGIK